MFPFESVEFYTQDFQSPLKKFKGFGTIRIANRQLRGKGRYKVVIRCSKSQA